MKRVLFIGMNFYEYENQIIERLQQTGYKVYHYCDANYFVTDHVCRTFPKLGKQLIKKYQAKMVNDMRGKKIDYIFVIVGRYLMEDTLADLKKDHPTATFILYLWDDVKRIHNYDISNKYFDRIYTFDPQDVHDYNLIHLPLFYVFQSNKKVESQYDVFSIMSCHTDREKVAEKYIKLNSLINTKIVFLAGIKKILLYRIKGIVKPSIDYKWKKIKMSKIRQQMIASKAILDIQFPSQIGLTMRTFDAMGLNRKLITTNKSIQYYDFYNSDNICIIDRDKPIIDKPFLEKKYAKIPNDIFEKYSIDNFLKVLFDDKKERYLVKDNPYEV